MNLVGISKGLGKDSGVTGVGDLDVGGGGRHGESAGEARSGWVGLKFLLVGQLLY
jgi:hypothetical protein